MTCLLCHQPLQELLSFSDLFLFRQKDARICQSCDNGFQKISAEHCPRCYKSGHSQVCLDCQIWENKGLSVKHRALYRYNTAMKSFFQTYKFQGDYVLSKVFAAIISYELKKDKSGILVPIPLSQSRFESRQFNQVTAMLEAANLPYQNLLSTTGEDHQSHLGRQERLARQNPFSLIDEVDIPEAVTLIDDIYTTGATLMAATQLLLEAGVLEVKTFSLAR